MEEERKGTEPDSGPEYGADCCRIRPSGLLERWTFAGDDHRDWHSQQCPWVGQINIATKQGPVPTGKACGDWCPLFTYDEDEVELHCATPPAQLVRFPWEEARVVVPAKPGIFVPKPEDGKR